LANCPVSIYSGDKKQLLSLLAEDLEYVPVTLQCNFNYDSTLIICITNW